MKIKILTEGGKNIGLGHISRCVALYEEAHRRNIDVQLLIYGDVSDVEILSGKNVVNKNWIDEHFLQGNIQQNDYVIVDSYLAKTNIYQIIYKQAKNVIYIDDTNRIQYPKGTIINPAIDISELDYGENNKVISGANYILLRTPFNQKICKPIREINRVLVMIGGTDIKNITPKIINTVCKENPNIDFDIVVNNSEQYNIRKNVKLHNNLNAEEMFSIMSKCDLAITGAGQTIYELMATSTPFIAIQVAYNQKNNINTIKKYISNDIVVDCTNEVDIESIKTKFYKLKSNSVRKEILQKQSNIIDTQGNKRIIDELIGPYISIRIVQPDDVKNVFELSNKEYVRQYSINKNLIKWEDHINWFKNTINREDVEFYIVCDSDSNFLGQVRFNIEHSDAIISISLCESIKGKGLGKIILYKSIHKVLSINDNIQRVIAFISKENIASKKLFEGAGFDNVDVENDIMRYELQREKFL